MHRTLVFALTLAACGGQLPVIPPLPDPVVPDAGPTCPPRQHLGAGGACESRLVWSAGTALPEAAARDHHVAFVGEAGEHSFLAIAGGSRWQLTGTTLFDDVWTATIRADGSLDAWAQSPQHLPEALAGPAVVQLGGRVYVMGGMANAGLVTSVYSAAVLPEGGLGPWRAEQPLLAPARYHHTGFVTQGRVCMLGGFDGRHIFKDVQCATANGDGTLSAFAAAGELPEPRSHTAVEVLGDRLLLVGGFNGSGVAVRDVLAFPFDAATGPGTPVSLGTLPENRRTHALTRVDDTLWVLNGEDGDGFSLGHAVTTSLTAHVDADGKVGPFQAAAEATPIGRRHTHQAPAHAGRVYCVGGTDESSRYVTDVAVGTAE